MDLADLHLHWRESRYQGKTYRSYSLARAYRHNGKNRKEIVVKLGKLTDEEVARWRNLLTTSKNPDAFFTTLDDLVVSDHFAYLDVAVANAIWDEWRLDDAFDDDGKRKLGVATIARILALNRCIDPAAKSQTPEWFNGAALSWMLDIDPALVNASRIFRELDAIEERKEAICRHLFERIKRQAPDSLNSVFYDLSSLSACHAQAGTTFSGSRCVLMKWGHCKEGYSNHVVLALVVNRDGLPFYWEVLPGGTADATTITWLLERLKERFRINETTLVFDRGMVSDDNLKLLEAAGIKYVSALDKSQLEPVTGLDFTAFAELDPERVGEQEAALPGFNRLGDDTYYREVKVDGARRYILCFNPRLFRDQRHARTQAVADFRAFVDELNTELRGAKKSRRRQPTAEKFERRVVKDKLRDFVGVRLSATDIARTAADGSPFHVRTYQGTAVVDEARMLQAGRLDGFWLLVTNHQEKEGEVFQVAAPEAIVPYREKVVIEGAFRDIKSFVEVAPVHVWTEAHVKAHYTICVLSHLINRTLTLRLHQRPGDLTREIVSHEKLFAKLSNCMIDLIRVENVGLATYNLTRPTDEQRELIHRADLPNLLSQRVVEKAKSSLKS
jgi:hypothetical protein